MTSSFPEGCRVIPNQEPRGLIGFSAFQKRYHFGIFRQLASTSVNVRQLWHGGLPILRSILSTYRDSFRARCHMKRWKCTSTSAFPTNRQRSSYTHPQKLQADVAKQWTSLTPLAFPPGANSNSEASLHLQLDIRTDLIQPGSCHDRLLVGATPLRAPRASPPSRPDRRCRRWVQWSLCRYPLPGRTRGL
jgi:hypothetical protein